MTDQLTPGDLTRGYNGNPLLKPTGVPIEWTPETLEEYIKCQNDPVYFANKYVQVVTLDDGRQPITLRGYQEEMVVSMWKNRNTIVTTARQAGKSTAVVCFMLWYVLFQADKTVALLANKEDTAIEILSRVQLAYQFLPKWLQQGIRKWNDTEIILENNSCIFASATSSSGIRGYTINFLFIDEAAHIENWDEFFTSVYPTISSGKTSKITLVSTPNGLNHFHQTWDNALKKKNEYCWIEVPWQKVPGRDEEWRQKTLSDMNYDEEKFNQEYCCQFLGSSGTLIAGWKLKELLEARRDPLKASEGLVQYEKPVKDHRYCIIADVSRGKGLDFSAFSIVDITRMPYRQVCMYRSNQTTPADYADVIHRTAILYNQAYIMVEVNDIGEQVSWHIHDNYEYENVLMTENAGRAGKRLASGFGATVKKDMGLKMTNPTKTLGCSMIKMLVEQGKLEVFDAATIAEMSTFSKQGNQYKAEPGKHDDIMMGLVIFGWMSCQDYFKELTDINTLVELRDKSEDQVLDGLTPFGLIDDHGSSDSVLSPDDQLQGWVVVEDRVL
jgi:hypothetical protein